MYYIRFAPFFRLTALGISIGLVGLTLAPLARAQQTTAAPNAAGPGEARHPSSSAAGAKPADAKRPDAQPGEKPVEPTAAKPPDKKTRDAARKAYAQGETAFSEGNYSAAYEGFHKAYQQIPSPHALYWMAKSLDKQDQTSDALAGYEKLLADPDAARLGEERLVEAKSRVEELKLKMVAVITVVTVPAGAAVTVDDNLETGVSPLTLKLQPGPHKIAVGAAGFETKEIDIDAKAGDKGEQRIELIAKPAPPPPPPPVVPVERAPAPLPPPPPPEQRSLVPAYVTLGIAGVGAVVGTVFGLKAMSEKSDFNDRPSTAAADDTERNALIADMAFGVAITLGVTGIVLLTSDDEAQRESAKAAPPRSKLAFEFDTYASKTGGGAKARLRF